MPIAGDLLKVLPFGEENAVTSRLLWKHQGMWPVASINTNSMRWQRPV
jgi:hypothetical protein